MHDGRRLSSSEILAVVSAVGAHISAEEVADFCSLLILSERVFLVGTEAAKTPTRWLASCLEDAGFGRVTVDTSALREVDRNDTVVVVSGPADDRTLIQELQPAIESGALLLAVATTSSTRILAQADAAITVVIPCSLIADSGEAHTVGSFTLLSVIAVDAIRADLAQRRSSISWPTPDESLPFYPAPVLALSPKLHHEERRTSRTYGPAAVSRQWRLS